jgi:hypothetical protein
VRLSTVERATGVVAGVTLFLAGVYAFLYAAMWLIFESGRVMTLMGWYGLLIPAALLATPMLALKWALSQRKKGREESSAGKVTDVLRRVAIHESGHAVLAELFYMNPEYVTIEPNSEFLGHLRRRGKGYMAHERWRDLLVTCAGHAAEGLMPEDVESDDMDEYCDHYDMLRWPLEENSDGGRIWASLREHSEDEQQQLTWFELAFAQTQRVLRNRDVWRSVESLAARLIEKRTVDRDEAAEVIQAALGRSKWNRDQFQMSHRYAKPPQTWTDSREEYQEHAKLLAAAMARGAK